VRRREAQVQVVQERADVNVVLLHEIAHGPLLRFRVLRNDALRNSV
jgi:hypothetical protein